MKTLITMVIAIIIFSGFVLAEDLSDYPNFFIDNGNLDVVVVVGDNAPSTHALAQSQVILSLTDIVGEKVLGIAKLASDIEDVDELNIISIGNACVNEVTGEILGNPEPCNSGLVPEKPRIEYHKAGTGKVHIVVNSYSGAGAVMASEVLSNYKEYGLEGDIFEIWFENEDSEEGSAEGSVAVKTDYDAEEEKQKLIEELNKKMEEQKETEEVEVIEVKEPEKTKENLPVAEPVQEEEEEQNFFQKIISWFLSLFGAE